MKMMRVICTEQDTVASEEEGEAAMEGVGVGALLGEKGGAMGQKMASEACPT